MKKIEKKEQIYTKDVSVFYCEMCGKKISESLLDTPVEYITFNAYNSVYNKEVDICCKCQEKILEFIKECSVNDK